MAAKTMTERKPKAPGENIHESQRRGLRIQFRISETEAEALRQRCEAEETDPNAYALRLLRRDLAIV